MEYAAGIRNVGWKWKNPIYGIREYYSGVVASSSICRLSIPALPHYFGIGTLLRSTEYFFSWYVSSKKFNFPTKKARSATRCNARCMANAGLPRLVFKSAEDGCHTFPLAGLRQGITETEFGCWLWLYEVHRRAVWCVGMWDHCRVSLCTPYRGIFFVITLFVW